MTANTRAAALLHILTILNFEEDIREYLKEQGYATVGQLISICDQDIEDLKTESGGVFKLGHAKSIKSFKEWLGDYMKSKNNTLPQDWTVEFTTDIFDEFVIRRATTSTPSNTTSTMTSSPSPTGIMSNLVSNVKIDIKAYPLFEGQIKDWKKYKRQFTSVATIHGISYLMDNAYVMPLSTDAIYPKVINENTFLYSVIEYSLAKSTAVSRVKKFAKTKDGRGSWLALVDWYEGQGSTEALAKKALQVITTHKLTARSYGGAELYMDKFENALQDLDDLGTPYDLRMAKINFLSNIDDDEYKITKETLSMEDKKSYSDALNEIRRKSIDVEEARGKQNRTRKANKVKAKPGKGKQKEEGRWLPKDKWNCMTAEQKKEHINKFKKDKDNQQASIPKEVPKLPSQYSNANSVMTEKESELYQFMNNQDTQSVADTTTSTLTTHQQKFLNMVRSLNPMRVVGYNVCKNICCCIKQQGSSDNEPETVEVEVVQGATPVKAKELDPRDLFPEELNRCMEESWIDIEVDGRFRYFGSMSKPFSYEKMIGWPPPANSEDTMRIEAFDAWVNDVMLGQSTSFDPDEDPLYKYITYLREKNIVSIAKSNNAMIQIPKNMRRSHNMTSLDDTEGRLLIDGGCDTSLVGNGFVIEATTNRTVDVQGFADNIKVESLPIVSAVTAVDMGDEVILLELHECIAVKSNQVSLLSTFQAREAGVIVNDVAKRHNGKQNIECDEYTVPLQIEDGLMVINIREPTEEERHNCIRLTLTNDKPWTVGDNDDTQAMTIKNDLNDTDSALEDIISMTRTAYINPSRTDLVTQDPSQVQAKLGWMPIPVIEKTLQHTTQLAKNHIRLPLRKHYKSRFPQLNKNRLHERYSTDTMFSSVTSLGDNFTCVQLFCGHKSHFTKVIGMTTESEGCDALETFIAEVGAPFHIMNDNAKMETSKAWKAILRKYNISASTTEPYHPHQNRSERQIQEVKKITTRILDHTSAPDYLWYEALLYAVTLYNHTSKQSLGWKTPLEVAFGTTPDISALVQFSFFEPVYYFDAEASFPHSRELPGRFVGLAENVGDALTFRVLTADNTIICRSVMRTALDSVNVNKRALLTSDGGTVNANVRIQEQLPYEDERGTFENQNIYLTWGEDGDDMNNRMGVDNALILEPSEKVPMLESEEAVNSRNAESILQTTQDITGNPNLPHVDPLNLVGLNFVGIHNGLEQKATVTNWTDEGKFIVKFINGGEELATYNDIVNKFNQRDEEGAELYVFTDILNHMKRGSKFIIQVRWDNGDVTWEPMKEIKECDPLTLAKYAHEKKITDLPGWKWTKRYSRNPKRFVRLAKIFKAIKKATKKKFKFGVQVPDNVEHAFKLDEENKNTLWAEAIAKEVNEVDSLKTFIPHDSLATIPKDYKFIPVHFVFDVKYDGRRKARLVAGGHLTNPDTSEIYSGVVSIEHVRLVLLLADLNDMDVIAADVGNAFLHGKTREKLYTIGGKGTGKLKDKYLLIDRSLYGLKTSAARWHEAFADILIKLGFTPSLADADMWFRDADTHYEYMAVYVDDLIIVSKDPMQLIKELKEIGGYTLKGVGEPEYYLGGDIVRSRDSNGKRKTILSAKTYIKNICDKIERVFEKTLRNYHSPLEGGYHPELDESELLEEDDISKYRMLIGSMNWAVTLGRIDVMFAATTLARYSCAPRAGHMKTALRVFGYLKHHPKGAIRFDTRVPNQEEEEKLNRGWKDLYPMAQEKIPDKFPKPKGKGLKITLEVDADHAHDLETRRSVTGVLLYLNGTLQKWYSKRQHTVETSTYGSELVAARIAVEMAMEYRYKLRMLGVPIIGMSVIYGDNMAVITNASVPSSAIKKKHHACAYHFVREASAAGIVCFIYKPSKQNRADALTKALAPHVLYDLMKTLIFIKE